VEVSSHSPALSVRYGAGWGGFSLARSRPYTGPGGYVSGNPRPAPVRGPPAVIPWTGPCLLPPIFNRDPSGVWVWRGPERGQGQGMPKKTPRPRPLSGAGRGKRLGARLFRGPVHPVMNSTCTHEYTPLTHLLIVETGICMKQKSSLILHRSQDMSFLFKVYSLLPCLDLKANIGEEGCRDSHCS